MGVYQFAAYDFIQGLRNAWSVERNRLRRETNLVAQQGVSRLCPCSSACNGLRASLWNSGIVLFVGQAAFAVFVFEVITYVHHYGLVVNEGEPQGPQHAWAHHCWITNCLTFNNTYHSDHHMRPGIPYYHLHAMYGVPHLPASYFTMFCVALMPPLWYWLMDPRLDAIAQARNDASGEMSESLLMQRCR